MIVFGACLLLSVLVSGVAARTVLSTSLVFLLAGAIVGDGGLGLLHLTEDSPLVGYLADLALFTVLFVDGTLAGFDWITSMLVGAVLAPTDPVFASAIVGRHDVPARLRRLLSVESGLNDGLALPVVVILIGAAGATEGDHGGLGLIVLELIGGLALGVVLPVVIHLLLQIPGLGAEPKLQPLLPLAVGILLYGISHYTGANAYLAAFAGGVTVTRLDPAAEEAFHHLGEQLAELAKFAALLVFGALLTPELLASVGVGGWAVAVLALVLVRPASLYLSLIGSDLSRRELFAAAWFGPKGFASVVYALLVVHSGIPQGQDAYELVAVCIGLSIVAHSSTDVPVARLFDLEVLADLPAKKSRLARIRDSVSGRR